MRLSDRMPSFIRACAGLLVVAHSVSGQMAMNKTTGAAMNMGCGNTSCMSSKRFMHENHVMHEGMNLDYTCNVAVDFVRGMIPHHAGAVKMCEVLRGRVQPIWFSMHPVQFGGRRSLGTCCEEVVQAMRFSSGQPRPRCGFISLVFGEV
eukprot:COSAG05_NODE_1047_length_6041_cov_141.646247_9_plen_149_part_00